MADVVARVELSDLVHDAPAYTVRPFGSGWVVEIGGTAGVCIEQFLYTEAEAHLRAAQLTSLMRHPTSSSVQQVPGDRDVGLSRDGMGPERRQRNTHRRQQKPGVGGTRAYVAPVFTWQWPVDPHPPTTAADGLPDAGNPLPPTSTPMGRSACAAHRQSPVRRSRSIGR